MDLKGDLSRPRAYERFAPTRVELVETHGSWVFLLDHDVFKVKKPVDLGFLDFRSIEQRKRACEAEVRLNARLAPNVYRAVVPVVLGRDGQCRIDGAGRVVDWAVHMSRLPDERRADRLLASGALTPGAIDVIARRIVAFHAAAADDPTIAAFGSPDAVMRNAEENFAQARSTLALYLTPTEAEEVERWQTSFVREHGERFEQRMRDGRVRDGHGDLRLEHVYLCDADAPTIIDCIEFNDRFRYADVCADVAFLSMDLRAHGRADLAERLLARYARDANDYGLYTVVDFYEAYRAFVRGKVSAMLAGDEAAPEPTRTGARERARRHFLLALPANRRPPTAARVVAVGGVIASGKSTIAEYMEAALSAPVLDADRTRKALLGVAPQQPVREGAWSGAYDPRFTDHVYDEVLHRASLVLEAGRPVILDASFRSVGMRRAARDLARSHGVPFHFVECRADPAVCRERLAVRERGASVSDGRLEIFDAFRARFEPVTELPASEHIIVETTRPLDECGGALRARLAS